MKDNVNSYIYLKSTVNVNLSYKMIDESAFIVVYMRIQASSFFNNKTEIEIRKARFFYMQQRICRYDDCIAFTIRASRIKTAVV